MLVVATSFALLAAGAAVTFLVRKQRIATEVEDIKEIEEMIEEYEQYSEAEPAPKPKPKRAKGTAAKNGHVSPAT